MMRRRKSYRVQFRIATLFLLTSILSVFFAWPHIRRRAEVVRLGKYDGKDIRGLEESEREVVRSLVASLTSESAEELPSLGFETWYIWRSSVAGQYLIIFRAQRLCYHPGTSEARLIFLDRTGNEMWRSEFSTGYRIDIIGASLYEDDFGNSILRIESKRSTGGDDVRYQYYLIENENLPVVRLEDSHGQVLPIARSYRIGLSPPHPMPAELWKEDILSENRNAILKALATLPDTEENYFDDAVLQSRLTALTRSDDPWLADAASSFIANCRDPIRRQHLVPRPRATTATTSQE